MVEYDQEKWMCENYKYPLERKNRNGDLNAGECDFFFDKAGFEYMFDELSNKSPKGFYEMSNEPLADAYFTVISSTNPNALLVKLGINQYLATTSNGKKHMLKVFGENKTRLETKLGEVSSGLELVKGSNL